MPAASSPTVATRCPANSYDQRFMRRVVLKQIANDRKGLQRFRLGRLLHVMDRLIADLDKTLEIGEFGG
jgi:hypothetical protein